MPPGEAGEVVVTALNHEALLPIEGVVDLEARIVPKSSGSLLALVVYAEGGRHLPFARGDAPAAGRILAARAKRHLNDQRKAECP